MATENAYVRLMPFLAIFEAASAMVPGRLSSLIRMTSFSIATSPSSFIFLRTFGRSGFSTTRWVLMPRSSGGMSRYFTPSPSSILANFETSLKVGFSKNSSGDDPVLIHPNTCLSLHAPKSTTPQSL